MEKVFWHKCSTKFEKNIASKIEKCVMNFIENVIYSFSLRLQSNEIFSSSLSLFLLDMHEYNQHVKKNQDKQYLESTREDFERRQLTNEFNSLNENRTLLRQKLTMIQDHHKHLEETVEREVQRKARMLNNYDEQIHRIHLSIRDYVTTILFTRPFFLLSTLSSSSRKIFSTTQNLSVLKVLPMK